MYDVTPLNVAHFLWMMVWETERVHKHIIGEMETHAQRKRQMKCKKERAQMKRWSKDIHCFLVSQKAEKERQIQSLRD